MGGTKGSRLGNCTGLLVIDVAAHTTSVHAWKNHRDKQRETRVKTEREGKRRCNMCRTRCKTVFLSGFPQAREAAVMHTML